MRSLRAPLLATLACLAIAGTARADMIVPTFVFDYHYLDFPESVIVGVALTATVVSLFLWMRRRRGRVTFAGVLVPFLVLAVGNCLCTCNPGEDWTRRREEERKRIRPFQWKGGDQTAPVAPAPGSPGDSLDRHKPSDNSP
jgi:hypothetical protein